MFLARPSEGVGNKHARTDCCVAWCAAAARLLLNLAGAADELSRYQQDGGEW